MANRAAEKRYDGIGSMFDQFCNERTDYFTFGPELAKLFPEHYLATKEASSGRLAHNTAIDAETRARLETALSKDRETIAERISALGALGRTDRWQNAVMTWARAVRSEDNSLNWAFCQGAIWANHAAE